MIPLITHVHTLPWLLELIDHDAALSHKTSNDRCLRTIVQALGTRLSNGLKQLASENSQLRTLTEDATHKIQNEGIQGVHCHG